MQLTESEATLSTLKMNRIELKTCCRTCLQNQQNQMKPLSTKWTTNLTFLDMLMDIIKIGIEIISEDTFLYICSTCETDLITAYNFKTVCQNTETILSELKIPQLVEELKIECNDWAEKNPADNEGRDFQTADNGPRKQELNTANANDTSTISDSCKISNASLDNQPKRRGRKRKAKDLTEDKSSEQTDSFKITNKRSRKCKKHLTEDKSVRQIGVEPNTLTQQTDSKIEEAIQIDSDQPPATVIEKRKYVRKVAADRKVRPAQRKQKKKKTTIQCTHCKRCGISFETSQLYQVHYKEVHQIKSPCSLCGKTYYPYELAKHIRTHSTDRQTCSICGSQLKSGLREHMRIHTGEKRYKCDLCDERFIHWNSKKNHMYIKHTKERKYECYLCQKRFGQRSGLKTHIRYHTGDLPYSCPFCAKRFPVPSNCRKHIKTHREIPPEQKAIYLQAECI